MIKRISLLAAALVISGCSSLTGDDKVDVEPLKLEKFDEQVTVKQAWKLNVGEQGEFHSALQLFLEGGVIYAANAEGGVKAISTTNRDLVWDAEVDFAVSGGVGADSDALYVGGFAGEVAALERSSGEQRWQIKLSGEILATPASDGDIVVVVSNDGRAYGLDSQSGKQLWRYDITLPALTMRGDSGATLFQGLALIALANGQVVALDVETGVERWRQTVALPKGTSELSRMVDVDGPLLVQNGILYAVSYQGQAIAIDIASGRGIWAAEASSFNGLASGFANVYVVEADSTIRALSEANGAEVWQNKTMLRRKLSHPLTMGNYVITGDYEGYVHLVSQVDGTLAGREKLGGVVRAPMVSDGSRFYAINSDGTLVAYEIQQ